MADEQTAEELARVMLQKYAVTQEQFGLGPFLDHGKFTLLRPFFPDDSIIIRTKGGKVWQCGSIALEIYKALKLADPESRFKLRMMAFSQNRQTHIYPEITDPQTGRHIQIDGTPWFAVLNPGHAGRAIPMDNTVSTDYVPLTTRSAIPFSIRRIPGGFMDVHILGGFTYLKPELSYQLELRVVSYQHFGADMETILRFGLEITDIKRFLAEFQKNSTIDQLQGAGALRFIFGHRELGIVTSEPKRIRDVKARVFGLEVEFAEIERNLPRVLRLLSAAKPYLQTFTPKRTVIRI